MSERDAAASSRLTRLAKIVDGITFALFVGAIMAPYPPILATAMAWSFLGLSLPLVFRGEFTLAIPRHGNLNRDPPRDLTVLSVTSVALGIAGIIRSFGIPIAYALGDAIILGGSMFVAALIVDPRVRTKTQTMLLFAQCAFWVLGARIAIVGLLSD
ncbi:MAG: hypothetical protein ABL932_07805 [Terricaulis sp.]